MTGKELIDRYNARERNFANAALRGSNLRWANLRGANLRGANLRYHIISATRDTIIATPGQIQIGCVILPAQEWLEKYKEIGIEQQYTEEQIAEYGRLIKFLNDCEGA